MVVENPSFTCDGEVWCYECPIDTRGGAISPCLDWLSAHHSKCPTRETYQEAVELAEKEAQR